MEAYISWSVSSDDIYDAEGCVIGEEEYALIEKIWVPVSERGQGTGRKLMVEALAEIAETGMVCKIAALPFDEGMDMEDLVAWYESFGFDVENCDGPAVIMVM